MHAQLHCEGHSHFHWSPKTSSLEVVRNREVFVPMGFNLSSWVQVCPYRHPGPIFLTDDSWSGWLQELQTNIWCRTAGCSTSSYNGIRSILIKTPSCYLTHSSFASLIKLGLTFWLLSTLSSQLFFSSVTVCLASNNVIPVQMLRFPQYSQQSVKAGLAIPLILWQQEARVFVPVDVPVLEWIKLEIPNIRTMWLPCLGLRWNAFYKS